MNQNSGSPSFFLAVRSLLLLMFRLLLCAGQVSKLISYLNLVWRGIVSCSTIAQTSSMSMKERYDDILHHRLRP
eukprot:m.69815 g.69815  ORF g.69815 m.69815 type:complete len:74 (-) comp50076_c0_seq14:139-360(-)